jgi:cell division cycle protein 20 (cofactor of APC complex)
VALSQSLYLWDAASGSIKELMSLPQEGSDYVSSVSWIQQGNHIAVGTAESGVQLWDVQAGRYVYLFILLNSFRSVC